MAEEVSLSAVVVNKPAALVGKPVAGGEYECDDVRRACVVTCLRRSDSPLRPRVRAR
jgi:hypothetical protein